MLAKKDFLVMAFVILASVAATANDDVASSFFAYDRAMKNNVYPDVATGAMHTAFQAQIAVAAKEFGGLRFIPATKWTEFEQKALQVGDAVRHQQNLAQGNYKLNPNVREALSSGGTLAITTGGSLIFAPGAPAYAILGKAVVDEALDRTEGFLAQGKRVGALQSLNDSRQDVVNAAFSQNLAEFWLSCRPDVKCSASHDRLLGDKVGGINDTLEQKKAQFPQLARDESAQKQLKILEKLDEKTEALEKKLGRTLTSIEYKQLQKEFLVDLTAEIQNSIENAGPVIARAMAQKAKEEKEAKVRMKRTFSDDTIQNTEATVSFATSLASLLGDNQTAQTIAQGGGLAVGIMKTVSDWQEGGMTNFAMSMNTASLALNGAQLAMSLMKSKQPSFEQQVMQQMQALAEAIQNLHITVVTGFRDTNLNINLSTNYISTQLQSLALQQNLNSEALARLQRDFQNAVESENLDAQHDDSLNLADSLDECREAPSEACLAKLKAFAVDKARFGRKRASYYLNRTTLEAGDFKFPFMGHLPLLRHEAKRYNKTDIELVVPMEWNQASEAYLSVLQQPQLNHVAPEKVAADLEKIIQAGRRTQAAILSLNYDKTGDEGLWKFREDLHREKIKNYEERLLQILTKSREVQEPHEYDKNSLLDAQQKLTTEKKIGLFYENFVSQRRSDEIAVCSKSTEADFEVREEVLQGPKSFTVTPSNITYGRPGPKTPTPTARTIEYLRLLQSSWNKKSFMRSHLPLPDSTALLALLPEPFVWAHVSKLGFLNICIKRFRPVHISTDLGEWKQRYTRQGSLAFEILVRITFTPNDTQEPIHLRSYGITSPEFRVKYSQLHGDFGSEILKFARESWKGPTPDSGETYQSPKRHIRGSPFRNSFATAERTSAKEYEAAEKDILTKLEKVFAENLQKTVRNVKKSDVYREAMMDFRSYLVLSAVGMTPVNQSLSLDRLFQADVLWSPEEFMDFLKTQKPTDEIAKKAIEAHTNAALAHIESFRRTPLSELPKAAQEMEITLQRLEIIREIRKARQEMMN